MYEKRFVLFLILARYAHWTPTPAELFRYARYVTSEAAKVRARSDPVLWTEQWEISYTSDWKQALSLLLSYEGLKDRNLCILFYVALQVRRQNCEAAFTLLDQNFWRSAESEEFFPGLFMLALQLGSMAIIKQTWRRIESIVQLDPDFTFLRLREAVSY